jgi:hypothetical protein
MLTPSKAPFYGLVLGNVAVPIGQVVLELTFGTRANYRTEYVKFEMANFETSNHAIPGCPALAKFMALPHYVYLLVKMPGPSGILSLRGDLRKLYDCDQNTIEYASTSRVPDTAMQVLAASKQLSQSELEILAKRSSQSKVKHTSDVSVKTIELEEGNSSKTALIGIKLDTK